MRLSDYKAYAVVSCAPARRHTPCANASTAAYIYDLLGALTGWAMLLAQRPDGTWHIFAKKGN